MAQSWNGLDPLPHCAPWLPHKLLVLPPETPAVGMTCCWIDQKEKQFPGTELHRMVQVLGAGWCVATISRRATALLRKSLALGRTVMLFLPSPPSQLPKADRILAGWLRLNVPCYPLQ